MANVFDQFDQPQGSTAPQEGGPIPTQGVRPQVSPQSPTEPLAGVQGMMNTTVDNSRKIVGNVIPDLGRVLVSMGQFVTHPIDSAKGIGHLAIGLFQTMSGETSQDTQLVDQLAKDIKDKYGSEEALRHSIINNPVQTAMDLSVVLYPFSKVLTDAGAIRTGSEVHKAAETINPVNQVVNTGNKAVANVDSDHWIRERYGEALKPSPTKYSPQQRMELLDYGAQNGFMPTRAGFEKLLTSIEDKNKEIVNVLSAPSAKVPSIKSDDVLAKLNDIKVTLSNLQWTEEGQAAIDQVTAIENRFKAFHGDTITPDMAQTTKKEIYHLMRNFYGKEADIRKEAYKAIAWGLKEELVKQYPELKVLNDEESTMIRLRDVLEKSVGRIGNQSPLGSIANTTSAGALLDVGEAVSSGRPTSIRSAIGFYIGAMNLPKVKAATAVALAKAKKMQYKPSDFTKASIAGAYEGGKLTEEGKKIYGWGK